MDNGSIEILNVEILTFCFFVGFFNRTRRSTLRGEPNLCWHACILRCFTKWHVQFHVRHHRSNLFNQSLSHSVFTSLFVSIVDIRTIRLVDSAFISIFFDFSFHFAYLYSWFTFFIFGSYTFPMKISNTVTLRNLHGFYITFSVC